MSEKYRLLGELKELNELRAHEVEAFTKIADYYRCNINVLPRLIGKTPDIEIKKLGIWEVKSPKGSSKNTIENTFKQAKTQSSQIIVDLGRCKLRSDVAIRRVREYANVPHRYIKRIKVLKKNGEIVDIL